jgi:hypothetical protein
MSDEAYVETTVLTNYLLKPGSLKCMQARAALSRYGTTFLPVFAIKEWKAGPLSHYRYVHAKLVTTGSLRNTLAALANLPLRSPYRRATSLEALAAAAQLEPHVRKSGTHAPIDDKEMADRYRLAIQSLIVRSWRKRRKVASQTIQELACYTEAEPKIDKDGLFDLKPHACDRDVECSLAGELKSAPDLLRRLRGAIPEKSSRQEDVRRRQVLKKLINTPKRPLDRDECRSLGDAIFAFFCPQSAVILTTNIRDLGPLARAIGKSVEKP